MLSSSVLERRLAYSTMAGARGKGYRRSIPGTLLTGPPGPAPIPLAHRVAAIGEKRDLLVQLHAWRLQDFEQASFRFGVKRLHEAKALARRGLVVLVAFEGQGTLG